MLGSTEGIGISEEMVSEDRVAGWEERTLDGTGISEANNVEGRALLRVWKRRGRRMRNVEWGGGGGRLNSARLWSGVLGSCTPSRPLGAKFRGSVIDMCGLRCCV